VRVAVAVGPVAVAEGVRVAVRVGVAVTEAVPVAVLVPVVVAVCVRVGEAVPVPVGSGARVGTRVGSSPGWGVGVRVATGPPPRTGATGWVSQKFPRTVMGWFGSIFRSLRTSLMIARSSGWMTSSSHGP
jgi:hypothetical protein